MVVGTIPQQNPSGVWQEHAVVWWLPLGAEVEAFPPWSRLIFEDLTRWKQVFAINKDGLESVKIQNRTSFSGLCLDDSSLIKTPKPYDQSKALLFSFQNHIMCNSKTNSLKVMNF